MTGPYPLERTTRLATNVASLAEAWAFVMTHVDEMGPDPSIEISPFWSYHVTDFSDMDDSRDHAVPREFSVVVSGMVKESIEPGGVK